MIYETHITGTDDLSDLMLETTIANIDESMLIPRRGLYEDINKLARSAARGSFRAAAEQLSAGQIKRRHFSPGIGGRVRTRVYHGYERVYLKDFVSYAEGDLQPAAAVEKSIERHILRGLLHGIVDGYAAPISTASMKGSNQ